MGNGKKLVSSFPKLPTKGLYVRMARVHHEAKFWEEEVAGLPKVMLFLLTLVRLDNHTGSGSCP
jgi:hypothetical protein